MPIPTKPSISGFIRFDPELTYTKEFTELVLELRSHIGAIRNPASTTTATTAIPQ